MKIFVAGHNGLVGSSILRKLKESSDYEIVTRTRKELDLFNLEAVWEFFKEEKFDCFFWQPLKWVVLWQTVLILLIFYLKI